MPHDGKNNISHGCCIPHQLMLTGCHVIGNFPFPTLATPGLRCMSRSHVQLKLNTSCSISSHVFVDLIKYKLNTYLLNNARCWVQPRASTRPGLHIRTVVCPVRHPFPKMEIARLPKTEGGVADHSRARAGNSPGAKVGVSAQFSSVSAWILILSMN